jgi:hypothetical protein
VDRPSLFQALLSGATDLVSLDFREVLVRLSFGALGMLLLASCATTGQGPPLASDAADNNRLTMLFTEDQAARGVGKWEDIDWDALNKADTKRREEVLSMIRRGELNTATDFYRAAMIFQHGATPDEIRLAYSLAWISATLDPLSQQALWLSAAAWDRVLMSKNLPQWYGTQYTKTSPNGPWELYKIDESAVTDEERAKLHVPPLSAARERVKELNK